MKNIDLKKRKYKDKMFVDNETISIDLDDLNAQLTRTKKTGNKCINELKIIFDVSNSDEKIEYNEYLKLKTWFFDYKMKLLEVEEKFQQLIIYLKEGKTIPINNKLEQNLKTQENKSKIIRESVNLVMKLYIINCLMNDEVKIQ